VYPHRIRLRGPWQHGDQRVVVPCSWQQLTGPGSAGPVQLTRSFGYPGRLDDFEHAWLTCRRVNGTADVMLNGQVLGRAQTGDFEYEVTPLLGPRNRLAVTLAGGATGLIWDEVALEIRRAAFLRAVARRTEPDRVEVTGVAIGPPGPVLELYAQVAGRNAHYQLIEPHPEGRPFRFTLSVALECPSVALDLVHVATSWFAVEVPIEPAAEGHDP
jgi:hypothetical protein